MSNTHQIVDTFAGYQLRTTSNPVAYSVCEPFEGCEVATIRRDYRGGWVASLANGLTLARNPGLTDTLRAVVEECEG